MKTRSFLFIFVFDVFLVPFFLFSLDPNKKITQYIMDRWEIQQGLPQNSVSSITQTADGYLWLGTEEGLVRYDGKQFKVFRRTNVGQLPDHTIKTLFKDRAGNLWIGTYAGGITCLKEGKFTPYTNTDDTKPGLLFPLNWSLFFIKPGGFTSYVPSELFLQQ